MKRLGVFIGLRFYQEKKQRGFVSFMSGSVVIGLMLGVATLIMGLSVMNGFEKELKTRLLRVIPHIQLQVAHLSESMLDKMQKNLQVYPSVVRVDKDIYADVLLEQRLRAKPLRLQEMSANIEEKLHPFKTMGTLKAMDDLPSVVLTHDVAQALDVVVGDTVSAMLTQTNSGNRTPHYVNLTVIGIVKFQSQIDQYVSFVPSQTARDLDFSMHGLVLTLDDVFSARDIAADILQQYFAIDNISTWSDDYGYLYQDIQLVRTLMVAIMLIVMAVACFNLLTSLVLLISEKRSEIAVLKTLGCRPSHLLSIFVFLGGMNGLMGTMLGVGMGIIGSLSLPSLVQWFESLSGRTLLDPSVYFISFVPVHLEWGGILVVAGAAIFLSVFAALYPAWQAIKLRPAHELAGW